MKNDFKMNYSEEDFIKLSKSFLSTGFTGRIIVYFFMYLILIVLIAVTTSPLTEDVEASIGMLLIIVYFPAFLILFSFEKFNIQKTRKKLGLSLYKNVQKELLDIAAEVRVAREKKAFEINGVNQGVDKNDIGYWHGLLKSGAITQEEYEAKKKELM